MRVHFTESFSRLLVSLTIIFLVAACSSSDGGFPQIANPPPFDYADGEELRAGMHLLAFELQKLDMALAGEHDENLNIQRDIVSSLQNIERIGGVLRAGDLSSTHTFLRDDMTRFLSGVNRARSDAERNPPRYYSAGRVSGACVNCHRVNPLF